MTRKMHSWILNGKSKVNGLGHHGVVNKMKAKTLIACIWIGDMLLAMALENMRMRKLKFTAMQKIIRDFELLELLKMMVHSNSTNFEINAYNLDMTECLVYQVLIYFDISSFLVFE